jgi:CSLREA domain-containing protein
MNTVRLSRAFVAVAIIGMTLGITPARITLATTYTVTKTADTNDGVCDSDCSLREAIRAANAQTGNNTVVIPSGTYTLTIAGANEDAAATGDLDITNNLAISGTAMTIVDGNALDSVFEVRGTNVTVTMSGITIRNGTRGINNWGQLLYLQNTSVSNNLVGGGICNFSGILVLNNSTVSGNVASGFGGGICNVTGVITITNSSVISNIVSADFAGGISNSSGSVLTLVNSTLSGNSASMNGGGILNWGILNLNNVTITNNTTGGDGGGIANPGGTVNLKNTILAGNTDVGGQAPDCSGAVISQGYNLIQSSPGCTISGATTGNLFGISPNLGPLQDNGGSTLTHIPLSGSPVIDAGNPATPGSGGDACESFDQRSISRPLDGDNNASAICDMGAVEVLSLLTSSPRYVSPLGDDTANACTNSSSPCRTVQHAIDVAQDGDEIRVAQGIYTGTMAEPRPAGGTFSATVILTKNLSALLGGYSSDFSTRDPDTNETILSASDAPRKFVVFISNTTTLIDGFTMTGATGACPTNCMTLQYNGGAIWVRGGAPTISHNRIQGNRAY